jgi:hypothetical protein
MKTKLSHAALDEIRRNRERQRVCQMYYESKKKDFLKTKNKENSTAFNYDITSSSSKEIPFKEIVSEETQSPENDSNEAFESTMTKILPAAKKINPNTEFQTIKNGVNYNACINALNKMQKSIIKPYNIATSKLRNSQKNTTRDQKSTKSQISNHSKFQNSINLTQDERYIEATKLSYAFNSNKVISPSSMKSMTIPPHRYETPIHQSYENIINHNLMKPISKQSKFTLLKNTSLFENNSLSNTISRFSKQ